MQFGRRSLTSPWACPTGEGMQRLSPVSYSAVFVSGRRSACVPITDAAHIFGRPEFVILAAADTRRSAAELKEHLFHSTGEKAF